MSSNGSEAINGSEASNGSKAVPGFGTEFPYSDSYRVIMIICFCFFFVLGSVGNAVVIASLLKVKFLRTRLNMLVVNLAIIDVLLTGYMYPLVLASFLNKGYAASEQMCKFNSCASVVLVGAEALNITFIALSRYLKVCKQHIYGKYFTRITTVLLCMCPWMFGFTAAIPHIMNNDQITFFPAWQMCFRNSAVSGGSGKWLFLLSMCTQYPLVVFLYYKILIVVRRSQRLRNSTRTNMFNRLENSSIRSQTLSCFVIFMVYILLCSPGLLQLTIFPEAPVYLQAIVSIMSGLGFSINCVIYGLLNKNVKRHYRDVLPTVWFVKNRTYNQPSTSTLTGPELQNTPPPQNNSRTLPLAAPEHTPPPLNTLEHSPLQPQNAPHPKTL